MKKSDEAMAWWREARFGLFIHWGLYAIPAGVWKGVENPFIAEWIMKVFQIPVKEYEQLAGDFNPVKFDAEEWVRVAKEAGMKYIVITAKHHDGFAMYDSKVSDYDIVDATPFGRDPMKELAEACRKEGIRLCFYYSHVQDWHHPDALGNPWDYPSGQELTVYNWEEEKQKPTFPRYLEEKAKPQVRELLTQYGPIGLLWYDTPYDMTKEQSKEMTDLVREIQPDCIVGGRVGNEVGDYEEMDDNEIPAAALDGDWQVPATMNDTWGFKKNDHNWKSTQTLLRLLVDIVSKGGNFLLNVGPTAEGLIPQPSLERLAEMGRWLEINGEAIYGSKPNPFGSEFDWGTVTVQSPDGTNPARMYLHFFDWPAEPFVLDGVRNKVTQAFLLADTSRQALNVAPEYIENVDHHRLTIDLPAQAPDENVSVVVLELDGDVDIDTTPAQRADGRITLSAVHADVHAAGDGTGPARHKGVVENWLDEKDWLSWRFKVLEPGTFDIVVVTAEGGYHGESQWDGGHEITLAVADTKLASTINADERVYNPRCVYWQDVLSNVGKVTIKKAGVHTLEVRPDKIVTAWKQGFRLKSVKLVPRP